jgi:hypothetical protein
MTYNPTWWVTLLIQLILLLSSLLGFAQAPTPTQAPQLLRPNRVNCNNTQLTWTKGSGTHTLLVVQDNTSSGPTPSYPAQQIDSTGVFLFPSYRASQVLGQGEETRPGWFVVYADTGKVANITHLLPNHHYTARAYSYNVNNVYDSLGTLTTQYPGWRAGNYYLLDSAQYVIHTLPACPSVQPVFGPSNIRIQPIDCSTARISLRPGNGEGRIVVVADNAFYTETQPVDGETYFPSPLYGQGSKTNFRKDGFVVLAGNDTSVTVYGLAPGRLYDVSAYEYNSLPGPDGGRSDVLDYEHTHSTTAHAYMPVVACSGPEPTAPATNLTQRRLTCNSVRLSWTPGSGDGRLVVMRVGGPGLMLPKQGIVYQGDPYFGRGLSQTWPGCYVLQVSNDTAVTVQGLAASMFYEAAVYEYRLDAQGRPVYLLSKAPASAFVITPMCPTVGAPTVTPQRLEVTSAVAYDFSNAHTSVRWTKGNGSHWVAFVRDARSGRASIYSPVDGVPYTAQSSLMDPVNHIISGTYVVAGGSYTGAATDSTLTLPRLSIGHEYELAIFEYNIDTTSGPMYNTTSAALTFRAKRIEPGLKASLNAAREANLQWNVVAEWQCLGYIVERSVDGITFSAPSTGPVASLIVQAGSDSIRQASYTRVDQPAISVPTYFRMRMVHRDGEVLFSNAVLLTPPAQPLPVELVSFTGKLRPDGSAQLNWITAQEKNSAYFELQRSLDGRSFEAIGRETAAGNSSTRLTYGAIDPRPLSVATYYRLRQVDLDGTQQYSSIVVLSPAGAQPGLLVWPNPVEGGQEVAVRLTGLAKEGAPVRIRIRSAATARLLLEHQVPTAATVEARLSLAGIPPGLYLVETETAAGRWHSKLLVR